MSIYPINDFLTTANSIKTVAPAAFPTTGPATTGPSATPTPIAVVTATPKAPTPAVDPTVKKVVDTVKLSEDARIQLLTQQGQSPAQIASALGLPLATIDSDLYIVPTPPATTSTTTTPATSFSIAA